MTLTCIIIDDEPLARKGLKEYVADVDFLNLVGEFENPLKATATLSSQQVHLIFLDIHMPKISGIDFLKTLQHPPLVILTTAYPQYALEGFDLSVLDYLLKPISFDRFYKAVLKAKDHYESRQPSAQVAHDTSRDDYIFIKADNRLVKLAYSEIVFVEALQNYVAIHTHDKKHITYLTFKSIEEIDFSFYNSTAKNTYKFDDSNGKSVLKTSNEYMEANHSYVRSLSARWSAAYELKFEKSTYDNLRSEISAGTGIEYNVYPYKASSSKYLVVRYMLFAEKRDYLQETIFDKKSQMLFSNDLGVYASFRQPWGSISSNVLWYNYLHDMSKNNLSFHANVELKLFKGVSLGFYGDASIINDQLSLAKGGASTQEVLLRLRALSTHFNYYTGISLNYRFGSKFNNFVNPRFTDGR